MKHLKKLEQSIEEFTDYFLKRYFKGYEDDWYWVADTLGGVLSVGDFFFNLDSMMDYVRYGYTFDELYTHYYKKVEAGMEDKTIANIRDWKKILKY
jgi:hypothetical protein